MDGTLKDFLVGVGFKLDDVSQRQAEDSIKKTEERSTAKMKAEAAKRTSAEKAEAAARERRQREAFAKQDDRDKKAIGAAQKVAVQMAAVATKTAAIVAASTLGAFLGIDKAARGFDRLTYVAKVAGASVANVTAFGYAASQLGSSKDEAEASLTAFGSNLRNNRTGYEKNLNDLHIRTRDAAGHFRDNGEIATDLGDALRNIERTKPFGYTQAVGTGAAYGFSENLVRAMMNPELRRRENEQKTDQARLGADPNAAAAGATELEQSMRRLSQILDDVGTKVEQVLFIKLKPLLDQLATWFTQNGSRIADIVSRLANDLVRLATAVAQQLAGADWNAILSQIEALGKQLSAVLGKLTGEQGLVLMVGAFGLAVGGLATLALPSWLLALLGLTAAGVALGAGSAKAEPAGAPSAGGRGESSSGASAAGGGSGRAASGGGGNGSHAGEGNGRPGFGARIRSGAAAAVKKLTGSDALRARGRKANIERHPRADNSGARPETGSAIPNWLDGRSRRELSGVNKDLADNLLAASAASGIKFSVSEGRRTQAQANANAASGAGVRNSQHLYGAAADLVMIDPATGQRTHDRALYEKFGAAFRDINRKRGTTQRWLGHLSGRWGNDIYHFDQGIGYGQTHAPQPFGRGPGPTKDDLAASRRDAYEGPQNPFLKHRIPDGGTPRPLGDTPAMHQSMLNTIGGGTSIKSAGTFNIAGHDARSSLEAARIVADRAHRDLMRKVEAV